MFRILKYAFFDLMRSRWMLIYCGFFLILTTALFMLSSDVSKVIITLMNVVLVLVPLISAMVSMMYVYSSREFSELLLAQPLNRKDIFLGQYLGISLSLALSVLLGVGVPFLFYELFGSGQVGNYLVLLLIGIVLSMIFSGIAFVIALRHENKIRGFGLVILTWLFLAVIYDGIFLLMLATFGDYPLDSAALAISILNPIDLSRILMLLKLDISALMGYSGAVFQKFLGGATGMLISTIALLLWIGLPVLRIKKIAMTKDF